MLETLHTNINPKYLLHETLDLIPFLKRPRSRKPLLSFVELSSAAGEQTPSQVLRFRDKIYF